MRRPRTTNEKRTRAKTGKNKEIIAVRKRLVRINTHTRKRKTAVKRQETTYF